MNKDLFEIIKNSKNVVFFGGAGVSTESNIPDFRSEAGLYNAQVNYGYSPEEMLSHSFFVRHTKMFYDYYVKNLIHDEAEPNRAHKALAKLEELGKLKAVITQNIDGLHQKAGSQRVYELHGTVMENFCTKCDAKYGLEPITDVKNYVGGTPRCKVCGGLIKPNVVLYEEGLDDDIVTGAVNAIMQADTLIVGGTSLVVYPAAGFLNYFRGKNLIVINKQTTSKDKEATLAIHESIGDVLDLSEEEIAELAK